MKLITNQNAIHCQKVHTDETVCEECELYPECTHETQEDIARLAIVALEKQIPKKCVKDDCDRDCCPVCGWIIGYGDTVQPHCHNFGQALDWSS